MNQKLKDRLQAEMERTYHNAVRAAAWDLMEKLDRTEKDDQTTKGLEEIVELLIEEYWLDEVMQAFATIIDRYAFGLAPAKGGKAARKLHKAIENDKFWKNMTDLAVALRTQEEEGA